MQFLFCRTQELLFSAKEINMAKKGRLVDSTDIAKMAGVSRGTVSKVLNNYPGISESTRERVLLAIKKSKYYPNLSAQVMVGKNRNLLGFFSVDTGQIHSAYITGLMAMGAYTMASRLGYQVLSVQIRQDGSNLSDIVEIFRQRRVDAGIFQAHTMLDHLVLDLVRQGYIVGVIDQGREFIEKIGCVGVSLNNYGCAKEAVSYLYRLGHRKIAVIPGDLRWQSAFDRERGFRDALLEYGLFPIGDQHHGIGFYENAGNDMMNNILLSGVCPTGIVCSNDNLAFGAIEAIRQRGLHVPGDISIVGMENNPISAYFDPPLTTFKFETGAWIRTIVKNVIERIEDRWNVKSDYSEFAYSLIERASCAQFAEFQNQTK
jgi:LacI family transcriptional regulator